MPLDDDHNIVEWLALTYTVHLNVGRKDTRVYEHELFEKKEKYLNLQTLTIS